MHKNKLKNFMDFSLTHYLTLIIEKIIEKQTKKEIEIIFPEDFFIYEKNNFDLYSNDWIDNILSNKKLYDVAEEINLESYSLYDYGTKTIDRLNESIIKSYKLLWFDNLSVYEHQLLNETNRFFI